MKYPDNWRNKTLEQLENSELLSIHEFECLFISRTVSLIKTPLCDFTIEDLRILISQEIGLPFSSKLAIEILNDNLFAEGDFDTGDLLHSLLELSNHHWISNPEQWEELNAILSTKRCDLHEMKISIEKFNNAFP